MKFRRGYRTTTEFNELIKKEEGIVPQKSDYIKSKE
jgi:hypothetical protein